MARSEHCECTYNFTCGHCLQRCVDRNKADANAAPAVVRKSPFYLGWFIWCDSRGSQRWKASRNGVRICNNSRESLEEQIRLKALDRHENC